MYSISEYRNEQARQTYYILEHFHMEYSFKFLGRQNRDGWECFAYAVTLKSTIHPNPASYTIEYYNGIGHVFEGTDTPAAPLPFSVLSSIRMDDTNGATFKEWCEEFGYNSDSRKALATYLQCQEQTLCFKRAFPNVNLDEDEEIAGY